MADNDMQDDVRLEPATRSLEDTAQEAVTATAQANAPASDTAATSAPAGRPPSQVAAGVRAPAAAPAYAAHRPAGRGPGARRERGGYGGRRRVCGFCVDNVQRIDYKDTVRLRRFLSERGKIEPRRKTGTCAKHQRWLTTALKRARELALLPYTAEHVRFMGR